MKCNKCNNENIISVSALVSGNTSHSTAKSRGIGTGVGIGLNGGLGFGVGGYSGTTNTTTRTELAEKFQFYKVKIKSDNSVVIIIIACLILAMIFKFGLSGLITVPQSDSFPSSIELLSFMSTMQYILPIFILIIGVVFVVNKMLYPFDKISMKIINKLEIDKINSAMKYVHENLIYCPKCNSLSYKDKSVLATEDNYSDLLFTDVSQEQSDLLDSAIDKNLIELF